MKLEEAIEVHDILNPILWNPDNTLKTEVRDILLETYKEFVRFVDLPLNIVDVEIVGSNASYNYNEQSDIDLHIIVNNELTYMDDEILQQLYNGRKGSFNRDYELSIEGLPVELYIEDIKAGNATNGRYSILKNEWVMFPKPLTYTIPDISEDLNLWIQKCSEALNGTDPQLILDTINEIYMMRKLGLAEDGEASVGNLVFKELRNMDMLTDLKDRYYELKSNELSI